MKLIWKREGLRFYYATSTRCQAFVFGAHEPRQMWAWAVYWSGGSQSAVELSYAAAKAKAEECVRRVEVAAAS